MTRWIKWSPREFRLVTPGVAKTLGERRLAVRYISRTKEKVRWNKSDGIDRGKRAHMSVFLLLFIFEETLRRRFWGAWSSTAEASVR